MRNSTSTAFVAFIAYFMLIAPIKAEHHLTGFVHTLDETPPINTTATLTLLNSEAPGIKAAIDSKGRFQINTQTPGVYRLEITAPDFPTILLQPLPITDDMEIRPLTLGRSKSSPPIRRVLDTQPLQGQILASTGRPISNALVWHDSAPDHFTLSDEQGRFVVRAATRAGRVKGWLQAESKGFMPNARRTSQTADRDLDLILEAAASIKGRVVDTQGRAAEAVEIAMMQLDHPWEPRPLTLDRAAGRAYSDSDGAFFIPRLVSGGAYMLRASRTGLRTVQQAIGGGRPGVDQELQLVMEISRPAFGRVVDNEERPIVDAEVTLRPVGDKRHLGREMNVVTDLEGRFAFEQTPARVEIFARKTDYAPLRVRGLDIPTDDSKAGAPGPFDLGTLILEPGAVIHGVVRSPEGDPIPDASLWIRSDLSRSAWDLAERLEDAPASAQSDDKGRFRLTDLPKGTRFHLIARHPDYIVNVAEAVEAPTIKPFNIVLEPGLQIKGRVVDQNEIPVEKAQVVIEPSSALIGATEVPLLGDVYRQTITTDAEGVFHFKNAAAGELALRASARGYLDSGEVHLDTRSASPRSELTLVMRRGSVLAGRITTTDDVPVVGARIEVGTARGFSDLDGDYRVEAVAPGEARIEVRHRVYPMVVKQFKVEAGVNRFDTEMTAGHVLAGRVAGFDGSAVRAALELRSDESLEQHRHMVFADDEGRFLFEEVAEGSYRLEARAEGYAAAIESLVVVGPEESLEVVMPREVTLTGRILGLDFDDLATLSIDAEHASRSPRGAEIDFDGRYTLSGLAPGDWRLRAQTRDRRRQIEAFVLLSPELDRVERDLEFGEGFLLSGKVLNGEEPVTGARISIRGHDNSADLGVVTDHEGRFQLEDVSPGNYRVGVTHPRKLIIQNRDIELTGDLDLLFAVNDSAVSGHIVSAANGQPIQEAAVTFTQMLGDDQGSIFSSPTDGEGFFGFPRLPIGFFRVTLSKQGYAVLEKTIEVAASSESFNFQLEPSTGLKILPRWASSSAGANTTPPYVHVALLGEDGRVILREARTVENGSAVVPTAPPGSWRVLVQAPGSALTEVHAVVPGDPIDVALPPGSRLNLRVPALLETHRTAVARIVARNGELLRSFNEYGEPASSWRVEGGIAIIPGIPAGNWDVYVESLSGEAWHGSAIANGVTQIEFSDFEAANSAEDHVSSFFR